MPESNPPGVGAGDGLDVTIAPEVDAHSWVGEQGADGASAASDAFQTLANDTRVTVLVHLLRAARDDDLPQTFSELQAAVDSDSSARFAYHLRQLDGHFVKKTPDGYELTPAGRRAAEAVLAGTFTSNDTRHAS